MAAGRDPSAWDGPKGCGSNFKAIVFHLFFQVVITQIFLNLFIAVIIDAFMGVSEQFSLPVNRMAMTEFQTIWCEFDPKGTSYIDIEDLHEVMIELANSDHGKDLLIVPSFTKESHYYRECLIE